MEMNIACATDNKFAPYCGIMLTSLFENNKENSFSVYIMSRDISEENRSKFDTLARQYNSEIKIIDLNNYEWRNCPIREEDHVTVETYYRLVLPDILPESVHKILYLDGDIIINSPIDDLYMQDIQDAPFGACVELVFYKEDETRFAIEGIETNKYFNAGVLLLNMDYWRTYHIAEKCFDLINANPNKLTYHDQDALNFVTSRNHQIKYLDITYNFRSRYIEKYFFQSFSDNTKRRVSRCALNPVIVHFASMDKPWHKIYAGPYQSLFLYYKKRSLWADTPQQKNYQTLRQYLGWLRRLFEMKIGLRRTSYMTRKELLKLSNKEKAT